MTQDIKYGYRNRKTGQLMRLETSFGHSEEYGDETNYCLTLEKPHPYLMSDGLADIFIMKYQRDFNCGSGACYESYPKSMSDFDIVRFVTTNDFEGSDADPVSFSTLVEKLEFKILKDLEIESISKKKGQQLFNDLDTLGDFRDVLYHRMKTNDHDPDDLKGSIFVTSFGRSGDVMPKGILDTRVFGNDIFIVTTRTIVAPEFHRAVTLKREPPGLILEAIPECPVKISFKFDNQAYVLLKEIWHDKNHNIWPEGWVLDDIDGAWDDLIVIFNADDLKRDDRFTVREMLDKIQNGLDPRGEIASQPKP